MEEFTKDLNLPAIDGFHSSTDNKITQKFSPSGGFDLSKTVNSLKNKIEILKNEKKKKRTETRELESQLVKLKHKISLLKEETENLKYLQKIENSKESPFQDALKDKRKQENAKEVSKILKKLKTEENFPYLKTLISTVSNKVYSYLTSFLAAKNNTILNLKLALDEKQKNYEGLLDEQRETYNDKISDFVEKIEKLNSRLLDMTKMYQKSETELEEAKKTFASTIQSFKEELKTKDEIIEDLENERDELKSEALELAMELRRKEDLLNSTQEQEELESKFNKKIDDLEFENKNLNNEIEILKIGRNQLEKQLREKDEKIDSVVHELESLETKKKSLITQITMMKEENEKLKGIKEESEIQNSFFSESSRDVQNMQDMIDDLKADINAKNVKNNS